jgi:hydroxyacylglutathione hydrolase
MFLERIHSSGLAHISYIVGDGGQAAVIDPRRDCEIYLDICRRQGARITHIFETHRNEDFVVGSGELARLTGAEIFHGEQLPFEYGNPVTENDIFDLGSVRLAVLSTPGHTDESISITLADANFSSEPIAVFTGDTLFVGDVGRTDFFPERAEEMAGLLYDSISGKLLPLGDHVIVFPAHGAGSACGGNLASREFSTIGYERRHNPVLQLTDRAKFVEFKGAEQHHKPPYFAQMEKLNLQGTSSLGGLPEPLPYGPDEFAEAIDKGMCVLDVRSPESFGGAHIPGSLAVPLELIPQFAGWFVPYDVPIGLVVENAQQIQPAVRYLIRLGFEQVEACLEEGMHEWETNGREFAGIPQVHIMEIKRRLDENEEFTLLDVRDEAQFDAGHLRGAHNIYVGELPHRLDEIPEHRPITTFCGTGHRAIIAASLIKRNGYEQVENCLGSMAACRATACPLTTQE